MSSPKKRPRGVHQRRSSTEDDSGAESRTSTSISDSPKRRRVSNHTVRQLIAQARPKNRRGQFTKTAKPICASSLLSVFYAVNHSDLGDDAAEAPVQIEENKETGTAEAMVVDSLSQSSEPEKSDPPSPMELLKIPDSPGEKADPPSPTELLETLWPTVYDAVYEQL